MNSISLLKLKLNFKTTIIKGLQKKDFKICQKTRYWGQSTHKYGRAY